MWYEHFAIVLFMRMQNLCLLGKKVSCLCMSLNEWNISLMGGRSTEETEREKGRKWIFFFFVISFFHHDYLCSFTERRQTTGRRLVDRCFERVQIQRMCSVCLQLIHFCSFSFGWRQQTFAIERDFSAGTSFCGSTNILKISLGIPFRANSYLLFNLHGRLSKK